MGPMARSHIEQTIARMREADTEFLTAETVAQFDGCAPAAAAEVLAGLGFGPERVGPVREARGADRRDFVAGDAREFAVIAGRRWTRIAEFMPNGQLTARFFADEATGEVRAAEGWAKPKGWAMYGEGAAFVAGLLAQAAAPAADVVGAGPEKEAEMDEFDGFVTQVGRAWRGEARGRVVAQGTQREDVLAIVRQEAQGLPVWEVDEHGGAREAV